MDSVKKTSLSIIVPCLNEEANVAATVEGTARVLSQIPHLEAYEILVINDGSTDNTRSIVDQLAIKYPFVKALHNDKNRGMGYSYIRGVREGSMEYCMIVPGDNELKPESIMMVAKHVGEADSILSYHSNFHIRPLFRRIVARAFTGLINLMTGFKIVHYNGQSIFNRHVLTTLDLRTTGLGIQADIVVQLLKRGYTYKQVPSELHISSSRNRVFRPKSVINVVKTLSEIPFAKRFHPTASEMKPQAGVSESNDTNKSFLREELDYRR